MVEHSTLPTMARDLAGLLQDAYGGELSERFVHDFSFEARHLGAEDFADFGTLVFLECHDAICHGETLSDQSLRRIVHRIRQRLTRRANRELLVDPSQLADLSATARQTSTDSMSERAVKHQISELSPDEAVVLHLYAVDGKTPSEIATTLGVSVATVYRRMKSARKNLTKLIG